jgi:hypothetical protein
VLAMQEELNNFTRNEVWHLVPHPNQNVVGTKWVFHNKQDEHGVVTMSHPALKDKAGCISYMRQEDNIYNNRVYRDKCHNNQSIYYIAEDLLQNKNNEYKTN